MLAPNKKNHSIISYMFLLFILFPIFLSASPMKPFNLASVEQGNFTDIVKNTQAKLMDAGFQVIGQHDPYDGATILVITNDDLLKNASTTEFGGYGAVQRVSITQAGDDIQVSFSNPVYLSYAYQMSGHLENVNEKLKETLGFKETFGSKVGLTGEQLGKYHYMFGMPYFTDPIKLNSYESYEKAVEKVKSSLAEKKGGAFQVYFQEIPGKKQAVIGVGLTYKLSADEQIMQEIDFKALKSTAHLPYEMLIHSDGSIYILSPKFRIAINFSDLAMVGEHSFVGIMNCPVAIRDALIKASGGEVFVTDDDF